MEFYSLVWILGESKVNCSLIMFSNHGRLGVPYFYAFIMLFYYSEILDVVVW